MLGKKVYVYITYYIYIQITIFIMTSTISINSKHPINMLILPYS